MPSDRFFYRPVPPNYEAIGQGIGAGVQAGVGNYYDEGDRTRQRAREDAADARVDREEAYLFSQRGGGKGPPPLAPQLDFGSLGGPGNILTGPRSGEVAPRQGPVDFLSRPDAPTLKRYETFGEGDEEAYWENPEDQRNRMAESAMEIQSQGRIAEDSAQYSREQHERDIERERWKEASLVRDPDADPDVAGANFDLMESGARFSDLNPSAARTTGSITEAQALAQVQQNDIDYSQDFLAGEEVYLHSLEEQMEMARALREGRPTGMLTEDEQRREMLSGIFGPPQGIGSLLGGSMGAGTESEPEVNLTNDLIEQIHLALEGLPPERWEEILAEDGFTGPEIKRILGK